MKKINDKTKEAKLIEDEIVKLREKLNGIYEEIEAVARLKREAAFRLFDDFKKQENKRA